MEKEPGSSGWEGHRRSPFSGRHKGPGNFNNFCAHRLPVCFLAIGDGYLLWQVATKFAQEG